MALAVVHDLREARAPADPDELAAFETDTLAGLVLARAAAGLADSTIAGEVIHLEQVRSWLGRPLWTMQPADADAYFGQVLRGAARGTRLARAQALKTYYLFELRKVALGTCGRDFGTPCAHENACVRCPLLRVDPAQMPRLEAIHANLGDRLQEAREQGWLGEVAAIETTMAAAAQKLEAICDLTTRRTSIHLGMPDVRPSAGRSSPGS